MIQFNLLPDIKIEYIKSKRTKRTVVLSAAAVAGGALGILLLLFLTVKLQNQHIGNLSRDIERDSNRLQSIDELDRVLTVQNQLNKLTELHDSKPVVSRLKGYITQVTPPQVSYATLELNFETNTMHFKGSADTLKTVNQFVDTLKFTKYKTNGSDTETNAFTSVVLSAFGKDDKGTSYEVSLSFNPEIFSSQANVELVVPNIVTTRSAIEKPTEDLIQPLRNPDQTEGVQ